MTESCASFLLQDILDIVSSIIEEVKSDQHDKFIHMLYDKLKDKNHNIAKYFQSEEIQTVSSEDLPSDDFKEAIAIEINNLEAKPSCYMKSKSDQVRESTALNIIPSIQDKSSEIDYAKFHESNEVEVQKITYEESKCNCKSKIDVKFPENVHDDIDSKHVPPVRKGPLMQGLENTSENSYVNVILHCLVHFPVFRAIISDLNGSDKLDNLLKHIVERLCTKDIDQNSLSEFIGLLGYVGYQNKILSKDPKDFYKFIIGRLRYKNLEGMISVTCTIKATSYNESFVTSGHPHESTEKYEVISIIVNNNNWKDVIEGYFSKKKIQMKFNIL